MHETNFRVKMWGGGQGWFPPNNQFSGNQQFNQQVRRLYIFFLCVLIIMSMYRVIQIKVYDRVCSLNQLIN